MTGILTGPSIPHLLQCQRYTQGGAENGDLCNYVYAGTGATLSSDSNARGTYHYNFTHNGNRYLIQLIWKNSGAGYCSGGY